MTSRAEPTSRDTGALVEARDVVLSFGETPALRGASLTASAGEVLAVMGPSGSGKSTLLHCLAGILVPAAGEIWFDGRRVDTLAEGPRKNMGHACEFETSMVLALRPELVRRPEIRDDPPRDDAVLRGLYLAEDMKQRTDHGAAGYPELATAEKGRTFLNAAIERTAEVVSALLRRPVPQ